MGTCPKLRKATLMTRCEFAAPPLYSHFDLQAAGKAATYLNAIGFAYFSLQRLKIWRLRIDGPQTKPSSKADHANETGTTFNLQIKSLWHSHPGC
mmetsp:Transcript_18070/g.45697  ORF Transcript_18070/g.45697 Transcript_18070/m.45697 type:complete len:95 (-) Transcript_18070:137-421(-)